MRDGTQKDLSKQIQDLEMKLKEKIFQATAAQAVDLHKEVQKLVVRIEDLSKQPKTEDLPKDLRKKEKDLCACFFCGEKHDAPKNTTGHISYMDGSSERKIFVCHYCAVESLKDLFAASSQETFETVLGKLLYNRAMDSRTW